MKADSARVNDECDIWCKVEATKLAFGSDAAQLKSLSYKVCNSNYFGNICCNFSFHYKLSFFQFNQQFFLNFYSKLLYKTKDTHVAKCTQRLGSRGLFLRFSQRKLNLRIIQAPPMKHRSRSSSLHGNSKRNRQTSAKLLNWMECVSTSPSGCWDRALASNHQAARTAPVLGVAPGSPCNWCVMILRLETHQWTETERHGLFWVTVHFGFQTKMARHSLLICLQQEVLVSMDKSSKRDMSDRHKALVQACVSALDEFNPELRASEDYIESFTQRGVRLIWFVNFRRITILVQAIRKNLEIVHISSFSELGREWWHSPLDWSVLRSCQIRRRSVGCVKWIFCQRWQEHSSVHWECVQRWRL